MDLYARATAQTRQLVAGIKPDQWTGPTPCTEWDVRQLVNHLVFENLWVGELLQGKTIAEVGDRFSGDVLDNDPLDSFDKALKTAKGAVDAPGAMETTCHVSYGDVPGSAYISEIFNDFLIHGWDVAKATGQSTTLDPDLVSATYEMLEPRKEKIRASGVFGTEVPVPPDADLQTKLLALLGRRV